MIDGHPWLTQAVDGSWSPYVYADVWYDGRLVYRDLPIEEWSVRAVGPDKMERSCTLTASGDDPALIPTTASSVLAPFGSEINLRAGMDFGRAGTVSASLGWFPITESRPLAQWATYNPRNYDRPVTALTSASVGVTCTDRTVWLERAKFTSTEASAGRTVHAEVLRLCRGLVPVGEHLVSDADLGSIVYESNSRLDALDLVAERIGARLIFNSDGEAILAPRWATTDEWRLPLVLSADPVLSSDGVYNTVASKASAAGEVEFVGVAEEYDGPLRVNGPFKRSVYLHSSPLIENAAQAFKDAQTTLANLIGKRQVSYRIDTPACYLLETLDAVSWVDADGDSKAGMIRAIEWRHDGTMGLDVWVPMDLGALL